MKNLRTLFAVCLLVIGTAVNAQFLESKSASSVFSEAKTEDWQGVRFSYNNYTIDAKGADYDAISAYEFGYVKSFSISQVQPWFIETGVSFSYATGELFSEYGNDLSANLSSLIVPLNVGYKVAISDNMSVFPYAGISFKGHIAGELEISYDGESTTVDVFDEDEMGDGETWKRFQLGWQFGATLNISNFNFGLSYGTDFIELAKKVDTKSFKISAGFNF